MYYVSTIWDLSSTPYQQPLKSSGDEAEVF